jgi:pimeloyl-ACP methyl ester carboxylesterase
MVGVSLGAFYVRAYQRRFPEQVAGIVFVDGTHDEAITFVSAGRRVPITQLSAEELRVAYARYEREAPKPAAGRADDERSHQRPDLGPLLQQSHPVEGEVVLDRVFGVELPQPARHVEGHRPSRRLVAREPDPPGDRVRVGVERKH